MQKSQKTNSEAASGIGPRLPQVKPSLPGPAVRGLFILFSGIALGLWSEALLADKTQVKTQAPLKPGQEREDYQECLTAVIKKYKAPLDAKRSALVKYGVASCRDRYPAVSIMIDCKKEMTAAYRENPNDLKAALGQCREEYTKFSFNPKSPIPFALRDNQVFFAGAGLNRTLAIREKEKPQEKDGKPKEKETAPPALLTLTENWGNYSCRPLLDTFSGRMAPEFLLFGNDPFGFTPLRHAKKDVVLQTLGLSPKRPKTVHEDLGELSLDPKSKELIQYFPSSYCFFNRKLGELYEGVKIYYLLDRAAKQVVPYFGVAFYQNEVRPVAADLAQSIAQALGAPYTVSQPKPGTQLVAQGQLTSFDAEGDPKNICQLSQPSPYVGIVHSQEDDKLASYALLANTANLCRFGDKVASRLLRRGLDPGTPPRSK